MNIGVIGCGVVGGALADWIEKDTFHSVHRYDPPKGFNDDLRNCEAFFVAVPVPTAANDYQIEDMLVHAIAHARASNCEAPIFIRSSVLPGTADKYKCISMPEFLTERRAQTDMECLPVLVGKDGESIVREIFDDRPIIAVSNREAELAKYVHNTFGAMKVTFFNNIFNLCHVDDLSYENVLKAARLTGFIEKTHTQVPGPDGKFGYGGTCFPKDVKAFIRYVDQKIGGSALIEAIDEDNQYYREDFAVHNFEETETKKSCELL